MELLFSIMLLAILAVASLRWGADSRDLSTDSKAPTRIAIL
jgi:hypothetical protein